MQSSKDIGVEHLLRDFTLTLGMLPTTLILAGAL